MELPHHLLENTRLVGWTLGVHGELNPVGRCDYENMKITVSSQWLPHLQDEEIAEIVLHEIGHALAGRENAHNSLWADTVRSLGIDPAVKFRPRSAPFPNIYTATCRNCKQSENHPVTPNSPLYCAPCLPQVGAQRSLLYWTVNGTPVRHSPVYHSKLRAISARSLVI